MRNRPVSVIELQTFITSAADAGMSVEEVAELIDHVAYHPMAADLIKDTGGVRKLRWARRGGGKRAGYRAIYFYFDNDAPVYAILVYGKGDRADISAADRRAMRDFVTELKRGIRAERTRKAG
jgi:hypothetical protein